MGLQRRLAFQPYVPREFRNERARISATARQRRGYGSHTFSFINAGNERFWVKFHFKTMRGHKHWTNAGAEMIVGKTGN